LLGVEDGESVAVVYASDHGGEFSGSQTRSRQNTESEEKGDRFGELHTRNRLSKYKTYL
jgi:hypothetical protein